jgi:hypothetical protein
MVKAQICHFSETLSKISLLIQALPLPAAPAVQIRVSQIGKGISCTICIIHTVNSPEKCDTG